MTNTITILYVYDLNVIVSETDIVSVYDGHWVQGLDFLVVEQDINVTTEINIINTLFFIYFLFYLVLLFLNIFLIFF